MSSGIYHFVTGRNSLLTKNKNCFFAAAPAAAPAAHAAAPAASAAAFAAHAADHAAHAADLAAAPAAAPAADLNSSFPYLSHFMTISGAGVFQFLTTDKAC